MTDAAPNPDGARAARSPVMADVARLAGVSHQTVSRVVNGHPSIRPATRERVEDAIRQLGYRPNSVARALVTRRSGTIGVIATNGGLWGPSTVHRTVQAAARESGYFVSSVNLPDVTREDLAAAVEHLRDHSVEGIVMIVANDEALDIARNQETGGVPVVVVEGDLSRAPWTVGVDQVAGARMATEHLLGLGHTQIAHVAGPQHWVEARARLSGWRAAIYDADLRPFEPLLGDWTAASGYAAGRVLAQRRDVTAVFVANDHMAIGVLRALSEAGRRVPEDLSVVGFDDIPESGFLIPPLTTVRQDFNAVGRLAIDTLQVAMRPETADHADLGLASRRGRLIDPELVLRTSTASVSGGES
jgi:DNA-binding LacI/PurR family transcriptional regulator